MTDSRAATISRDARPLVLDAVYAPSAASLCRFLASEGLGDRIVVADLSLGAWRSHMVAADIRAQLGLTPPASARLPDVSKPATTLPAYADMISAGIDTESRGDQWVLAALDLASDVVLAVRDGAPGTFMVVPPRFGSPWERENELFVQFLAQGLRGGIGRVVLACADRDGPALPEGWSLNWLRTPDPGSIPEQVNSGLLGLLPGVVDGELTTALGLRPSASSPLWPLSGGRLWIPSEYRRAPSSASRLEFDRLAVAAQTVDWLHAYAQFHGNNFFVQPHFLFQQACRLSAEGGHGIALRLIERAIACARSPQQSAMYQACASCCIASLRPLRRAIHRQPRRRTCAVSCWRPRGGD
jgi:hypothetical protein